MKSARQTAVQSWIPAKKTATMPTTLVHPAAREHMSIANTPVPAIESAQMVVLARDAKSPNPRFTHPVGGVNKWVG